MTPSEELRFVVRLWHGEKLQGRLALAARIRAGTGVRLEDEMYYVKTIASTSQLDPVQDCYARWLDFVRDEN